MNDTDDRYLRLDELAAYSTISVSQLRRFSRDPVHPLPHHKIGRAVLYKRSEFDEWLREHEARTPKPIADRAYQIALAVRGHR